MLEPYELGFMIAGAVDSGLISVFSSSNVAAMSSPPDRTLFLDAGSVDVERGGGAASVVKLAVLAFDGRDWDVLHPVVNGFPLAVFKGGDNVRRGLTYLIELAGLLAGISMGYKVVIRHGPLQQVHYYLRAGYDVEEDLLRAALHYAGLDPGLANSIVADARLSSAAGKANVGVALLAVLEMLVDYARRGMGVFGVVENVSRSRVLLGDVVAEVIQAAWRNVATSQSSAPFPSKAARLIYDLAARYYEKLMQRAGYTAPGDFNRDCLCLDVPGYLLSSAAPFIGLVDDVYTKLKRYTQLPLDKADKGYVSLVSSELLQGYNDPIVVSWLYFLDAGSGVFTQPRPRLAAYWAAEEELNRRCGDLQRCSSSWASRLLEPLKSVYYIYMAPEVPHSCLSIKQVLASLRPCDAAGVLKFAVPTRVEILLPKGNLGQLHIDTLNYLYSSAAAVLYKYPAPLLLADKFSRVTPEEASAGLPLAELLAKTRVPYSLLLHGWENRENA